MPAMGMAWVGEHDSPRGAPRNKDGTVSQLTYRFSGKLRKRFYEDASLESVHLRKARRQRAVAQTEAKLERVLASMKSEAAFIERMERTLAREQEADIGAASIVFGAVVLQSAWRTHKARLRVRNLRETRALGILSVNLKSYVIKRRKHAVATKYQSRVRVHLAARIVRRLFAMRTSALLLQAQWRGIRSRSEIRHLRLVNIVAEGYVEQICLYAMARLYQRRILPQIASGVIQRKWHRYRARRDALEARAKKSRGSAAMRSRAYQSIQRDSGAAGGANVWERHRASMAQSMANLAKTDAEQREKARKTLKSPGSSALMQRTAIQSLTFVRRASQASNKPGSPNTIQSSLYNFASPDAPKRDGSDATGSEPSSPDPGSKGDALRESGRKRARAKPRLDTGQGGAARGAPSPKGAGPSTPGRKSKRDAPAESARGSARAAAKKADDRGPPPPAKAPAKKPDAADEPPPAVKPRKRKTSIFQAPLVAGGMLSMLQAGAGGARAAAPVDAPIIDMTPITASDLILTPATGEAANYAPPPPPFISAEFFDLLNPEEIESLEMMRKQKLAESREETLRSEGSKVMMTRTMARRPSNVGAAGPGLDKDGLDKQKSFRNDRLVSLRKASLHALNFSGRGGLRPGGGRRMSASGLSLSEGGAGGGAPKASAPPRRASVTVDQLKNLEKTSAGNLADSIMNSGRSRRSTIAEGTAKAFGNLTAVGEAARNSRGSRSSVSSSSSSSSSSDDDDDDDAKDGAPGQPEAKEAEKPKASAPPPYAARRFTRQLDAKQLAPAKLKEAPAAEAVAPAPAAAEAREAPPPTSVAAAAVPPLTPRAPEARPRPSSGGAPPRRPPPPVKTSPKHMSQSLGIADTPPPSKVVPAEPDSPTPSVATHASVGSANTVATALTAVTHASAATKAAPPPDELLATSVESDAATAAAPAAAPAPAARAAGDDDDDDYGDEGFEEDYGDDEFED
ncbi:hypothetical protein AURANDRAFT_62093 [Aureococcus anophagefferens]|uniref:Uncharacterized protein n=1 Tax=Aureococcus anophagefferens TaxID=44056 RepID=F0Y2C6_AURAN|nr:hypothetical protein AURANDRAFT_62093 [Aureococcus anophagefferens]EGB11098.1 hypothetical protein AURANDRAFT_62093 [Aureococcus anophagefferens]|eukprot:XP_009034648.1 hypothetical protein AURANDRAFT_62093 [Aureococcus anophagefferens]